MPYPTALGINTPRRDEIDTSAIANKRATTRPYLSEICPNNREPNKRPTITRAAYICKTFKSSNTLIFNGQCEACLMGI